MLDDAYDNDVYERILGELVTEYQDTVPGSLLKKLSEALVKSQRAWPDVENSFLMEGGGWSALVVPVFDGQGPTRKPLPQGRVGTGRLPVQLRSWHVLWLAAIHHGGGNDPTSELVGAPVARLLWDCLHGLAGARQRRRGAQATFEQRPFHRKGATRCTRARTSAGD